MEKSTRLLAFLSLLFATSSGSLQIMHPKELRMKLGSEGKIAGGLGNFGHIIYGSSVVSYYKIPNPYRLADYTTLTTTGLVAMNSKNPTSQKIG